MSGAVKQWLSVIDNYEEGEIPPPPVEELVDWLSNGGVLDETQSIALVDVIGNLQTKIARLEAAAKRPNPYGGMIDDILSKRAVTKEERLALLDEVMSLIGAKQVTPPSLDLIQALRSAGIQLPVCACEACKTSEGEF